jgi:hypothetical protein
MTLLCLGVEVLGVAFGLVVTCGVVFGYSHLLFGQIISFDWYLRVCACYRRENGQSAVTVLCTAFDPFSLFLCTSISEYRCIKG